MKILGASAEAIFPHEKEKVLRVVGAPGLIVNWHPWIERISIIEQQGLIYRKAILSGGETELVEKYWNEEGEDEFHYQAVQGLWSDFRYRSKIRVDECEEGCKVTWEGRLIKEEAEDEADQMENFYQEGLRGLGELLDEI